MALPKACWRDLCNVAGVHGKAENRSWGTAQQKKNLLLRYSLHFRKGELKYREMTTWLKLHGGPLTMVGCGPWSPDPQIITRSSRSSQLFCPVSFGGRCVVDVNHHGALAAAPELSSASKAAIHPCVAIVKMCLSLLSLELMSWLLKASPSTLFPVPYFSFGCSSLFSELHLVLKAYGAAGLQTSKIITVEDGSAFFHQLPWLKQVPAALGEKLLAIKLLPVRKASWKLSVFNILMKSTIKTLTTRLVAFQWHVLHLSLLFSVWKSDQRLQKAAETCISGILTPQKWRGGGIKKAKPRVSAGVLLSEVIWTAFGKSLSIRRRMSARRIIPAHTATV